MLKPSYKIQRGTFLTPDQLDGVGVDLDGWLGRKVRLSFGLGVLVKMAGDHHAVRVRIKCETPGCRDTKTVYARPAAPGGWCFVYNRRGKFMADMRDQCFICASCKKRGLRP